MDRTSSRVSMLPSFGGPNGEPLGCCVSSLMTKNIAPQLYEASTMVVSCQLVNPLVGVDLTTVCVVRGCCQGGERFDDSVAVKSEV